MSFLTPLAFIAGLLSIPIILMYMLRLRRREVTISSTFLWRQVLQDREANTPWQRLRRNLLLLLQLIILALMVLALARPFVVVPAITTGQIALLLDASASMNATDSADGARFAEAKRRALDIVDTMGEEDTLSLIRVADVPEALTPYTADRALLRQTINSIQPSQASADWTAALTLAAAGSAGADRFSTVIISDGGLGDTSQLPAIPGEMSYIPVGQSGSNVAITALATRALPGQPPQLFAQMTNYGAQDADVIFDLRVDGNLLTARRYTVPAGQDLPLISQALPQGFKTIQAGLTLPTESTVPDYLAEDNTAWAVASDASARRALIVSDGNLFLEQIFRSLPTMQAYTTTPSQGLPTNPFDLYIFDGWLPDTLPNANMLIINPPGSTSLFTIGDQTTPVGVPAVVANDPRTLYVDFTNVHIQTYARITGADWADPLITVDGNPLLLAGVNGGRQIAVLTFDLHKSTLPLQIYWPVLMANLLDWFTPPSVVQVTDSLKVGDSLALHPPLSADSVRVTLPDGSQKNLDIGSGTPVFADTQTPGLYTVEVLKNGQVTEQGTFAVNLFDANESNITPQQTIKIGSATIAQATQHEEVGQREYWPWLAFGALMIAMIEWYAYHKRLQAPTVFRPLAGKSA